MNSPPYNFYILGGSMNNSDYTYESFSISLSNTSNNISSFSIMSLVSFLIVLTPLTIILIIESIAPPLINIVYMLMKILAYSIVQSVL